MNDPKQTAQSEPDVVIVVLAEAGQRVDIRVQTQAEGKSQSEEHDAGKG